MNQILFISEREIKNLLEDIHDAVLKIISYTKDMSYDDFKTEHPEIEWRRIIGFRNRIIHEYFGIDYENLWRIKNENIPTLSNFLEKILDDLK